MCLELNAVNQRYQVPKRNNIASYGWVERTLDLESKTSLRIWPFFLLSGRPLSNNSSSKYQFWHFQIRDKNTGFLRLLERVKRWSI